MTTTQLWQWIFLIALILFGIYTLMVIKRERRTYEQDSVLVDFFDFQIPTPSWWSEKDRTSNMLTFHRTDTRYEWFGVYEKIESVDDLNDFLAPFIEKENIYYDQDEVEISTEPEHLIKDPDVLKEVTQFIRVEGTATEKVSERIYLDIVLIKLKDNQCFKFLSHASVLNGGIEGPYFEEAIKGLQIKTEEKEEN
jgi:hypothetical protein